MQIKQKKSKYKNFKNQTDLMGRLAEFEPNSQTIYGIQQVETPHNDHDRSMWLTA